jgi:hypothetical protein
MGVPLKSPALSVAPDEIDLNDASVSEALDLAMGAAESQRMRSVMAPCPQARYEDDEPS